jgi:anti-anti-sigma factor
MSDHAEQSQDRVDVLRVAGDVWVLVIRVPEHFESMEFDPLNAQLAAIIDGRPGGRWVVDMTHIRYAGSAMLGMLVNVRSRVRRSGGTLVLCCMDEQIRGVLRAGSMERLFAIVETRDEAVRR